jgi:hypothetical protein
MPDGFDPGVELARIYTLKELMSECRARTPIMLRLIDEMLEDPDLQTADKLNVIKMVMDRGYGKPRQTVIVNEAPEEVARVQVYIPDNGRSNQVTKTIDVDAYSG